MANKQILVAVYDDDGSLQETILDSTADLVEQYEQIGIDDCSTDLSLRGYPVVKGLVGPIPENKTMARYESAAVFEANTKVWAATRIKRRRRTRAVIEAEMKAQAEELAAAGQVETPAMPPAPHVMNLAINSESPANQ